jgi:uncharacterized protein YjbI with pentapeptide repeats
MRLPAWLGVGERRWRKSPDEDVQPAKTLWDFLQLLIVPVLLVVIALSFNASQASRERSRNEETRRDATLDAYLAQMSDLILNGHLLSAERGSAVTQVARAITLAAVRRLDGRRKGEVVRFVSEAGLLDVRVYDRSTEVPTPLVSLSGADLRDVDLAHATIAPSHVDPRTLTATYSWQVLLGGDLRGAIFDGASLDVFFEDGADLQGASFKEASLSSAAFREAHLEGASFEEASLSSSDFHDAHLEAASFKGALVRFASFFEAFLDGVVFDGADIDQGSFERACLDDASFVGAEFNFNEYIGEAHGRTIFRDAEGMDVDFRHAKNLASLRFPFEDFPDAHFEGPIADRPKPIPPSYVQNDPCGRPRVN